MGTVVYSGVKPSGRPRIWKSYHQADSGDPEGKDPAQFFFAPKRHRAL